MRHGFRKVAAISPRIRLGDAAYNAATIADAAARASEDGAQVAVFPAHALTGATGGDLTRFPAVRDAIRRGIEHILDATEELPCVLFFGAPLNGEDGVYAVLRGEILGFVPETSVPTGTVRAYERDFWVGNDLSFQCEEDDMFSIAVSFDGSNPLGANAIVRCAAQPEFVDSAARRRLLLCAQSLTAGCVYASSGAGESTTDYVYGGARAISECGEILAESAFLTEGATYAELDFHAVDYMRMLAGGKACGRKVYFRAGARVDTNLTRKYSRKPFIPDEAGCERILELQSAALAARVEFTHAPHLVLGVSGGLDSTLALLVACRAMERLGRSKLDVVAVTMPCFGTTGRTLGNATRLMRELGVTDRKIVIKKSVLAHFDDINHDPAVADVTYENAQARERTQVLMDLANELGGFVVGTGDLSELALGWTTYNGDHMSMYGVNAGIPKTLVRAVVGYAKDAAEARGEKLLAKTLADILETPISPELLPATSSEPAQKTEDTVGPYELHDFFLYHMLKLGAPPDKILRLAEYAFAGKYNFATIDKWLRVFLKRFFASQFKRNCMPDGVDAIGLSLSPRIFTMPSDMSAADWLAALDD